MSLAIKYGMMKKKSKGSPAPAPTETPMEAPMSRKERMLMAMSSKASPLPDETEPEAEPAEDSTAADMDLVSRIMKKRQALSEGGKVAATDDETADEMPNDFDVLDLDNSAHEESAADETAANSGDDLGAPADEDLVSKIMRTRKR